MKVGNVTITVEPHVIEATMFAVKDPKPPAPTTTATFRPIIQYGPPNGVMPPPPKPATPASATATPTAAASPSQAPARSTSQAAAKPQPSPLQTSAPPTPQAAVKASPSPAPLQAPPAQPTSQASVPPSPVQGSARPGPQMAAKPPPSPLPGQIRSPTPSQPYAQAQPQPQAIETPRAAAPPGAAAAAVAVAALPNRPPLASPRGLESVLAAPGGAAQPPAQVTQPPLRSPSMSAPMHAQQMRSPISAPVQQGLSHPRPLHPPHPPVQSPGPPAAAAAAAPSGMARAPRPPAPTPAPPAPMQPARQTTSNDPIILGLAERANEDPYLRGMMKRVALGSAAPHELSYFQKIIDQITADYKKRGGQQGPSAERLIVDGRTVRYFADEVDAILDIVLASNPNQKGADLKPPANSDALVIALVRKALDDVVLRSLVKRVATNKTRYSDTTDLKSTLDKLKDLLPKNTAKPQKSLPSPAPSTSQAQPVDKTSTQPPPSRKSSLSSANNSQQALRSKGPPPNPKPDISAIVFEFAGGTGDRYLFPKFSILEYQPGASSLLASFLIVRKGSKSEYGGNPALDYYQPVTIRIQSNSGKHLDNIARVVAPQDEVRRYMDDVMDNMTRAEYVLLAMRLPRDVSGDQAEETGSDTAKSDSHVQQQQTQEQQQQKQQQQKTQGVLWTTKASKSKVSQAPPSKVLGEEEQYQNFIATIS